MSDQTIAQEASLKVVLPVQLTRFFDESGYAPTVNDEHRTVARLRVRTEITFQFSQVPKGLRNLVQRVPGVPQQALLKDLSRSGIGLLYYQQIYPGEHLEAEVHGRLFEIEVVRCRRLGTACYEIGGLTKLIAAAPPGNHE